MLFETEALEYRYEDGTAALEEVTLQVRTGDRVVVLGANGSGKSTLLRILNGLLFASSGSVKFEGRELTETALRDSEFRSVFRRKVGFVFQNADAQLFNATVFEEIAFGPRQLGLSEHEVRGRAMDILQFLGIDHLRDRPPFRLSGGEKRKVALASILSMNPEALILDEPFLGLDPRSQQWLVRTLRQLHEAGKTIVVATHTLEMIPSIADTILVLSEDHRSIAGGPAEQILADGKVLRRANLIE